MLQIEYHFNPHPLPQHHFDVILIHWEQATILPVPFTILGEGGGRQWQSKVAHPKETMMIKTLEGVYFIGEVPRVVFLGGRDGKEGLSSKCRSKRRFLV